MVNQALFGHTIVPACGYAVDILANVWRRAPFTRPPCLVQLWPNHHPAMTNHITLSGEISGIETTIHGYDGLYTSFTLFTGEWWHDRQDHPHMLNVLVRIPAKLVQGQPLDDGLFVQVDGRLSRWSVGRRFDSGRAVTGIEAEQITVIPPEQASDLGRIARQAVEEEA